MDFVVTVVAAALADSKVWRFPGGWALPSHIPHACSQDSASSSCWASPHPLHPYGSDWQGYVAGSILLCLPWVWPFVITQEPGWLPDQTGWEFWIAPLYTAQCADQTIGPTLLTGTHLVVVTVKMREHRWSRGPTCGLTFECARYVLGSLCFRTSLLVSPWWMKGRCGCDHSQDPRIKSILQ